MSDVLFWIPMIITRLFFIQYLIAGIERQISGFGKEALPIVAQGGLNSRVRLLVTAIVNELVAKITNGLVIVLDDFHVITDPGNS